MASDYSRVHRLLRIIMLVQGGEAWTPAKLAKACETTERSIYRDIECIQAAGVPLEFDRKARRYQIGAGHFLPPTQLTLDEALAVMAVAEGVGKGEQVPHLRPVVSAAQKLRSQLDPSLRQHLEKADGRVTIRLAATNPPESTESAFDRVRQAVAGRFMLDVEYESLSSSGGSKAAKGEGAAKVDATQGPKRFKLCPYELVFDQRAWYVVGHSMKHEAVRTFKLSRFTRLIVTAETFELPRGWSLEKHRGQAWRMVRGDRRYDVELQFDARFAETVADTMWHRTQEVEQNEDGSMTFTCTVDGLDEIVWWVLGMGPYCKVIRPPELAEKVAEMARQMAAQYGTQPYGTAGAVSAGGAGAKSLAVSGRGKST